MAALTIPNDFPRLPAPYGRPKPQIPMPSPYGVGRGADMATPVLFGRTGVNEHSAAKQREEEDYKRRVARENEELSAAQAQRAQQEALFKLQQQQQELALQRMQYPDYNLVQTEYGGMTRPNYEQMMMERDSAKRAMDALRQKQNMQSNSQTQSTTNREFNIDPSAIQAIMALMPGRV